MKLLDSEQNELAVLDEGTTKIAYYGKDPALIYFVGTGKDHGKPETVSCTVKKIEALEGFIETDAGNKVKIVGTLCEKINILETVLGTKLGYVAAGTIGSNPMPQKTVKFYHDNDEDDGNVITVNVTIGEEDPLEFKFTRGPNAVTVEDILAKLTAPEGKVIVGLVAEGVEAEEANALGKTDKILEDQNLTAVVADVLTLKVKRALNENDEEAVNVVVGYEDTVGDALNKVSTNETILGWINDAAETATFVAVVRDDGTTIGTKAMKASASTIDTVKLSWEPVVPAIDEQSGEQSGEQQSNE